MGTVHINGKQYDVPDNANISVIGDLLYVTGIPYSDSPLSDAKIEIKIEGPVFSVSAERGSITVDGNIGGDVKAGGSVSTNGNIGGNVSAGGSVKCNDVLNGNVSAGGSIKAGMVNGSANCKGSLKLG